MAFQNFPNKRIIKEFDADEIIKMGTFNLLNDLELEAIKVFFLFKGTLTGSERIRAIVYSSSGYESTSAIATSDWLDLSSVSAIAALASSQCWHGWLRLYFDKQNLNADFTYYVGCEIDNFTPNGDTKYCGLLYDYPYPTYDNGAVVYRGVSLGMQLYGAEEI